MLTVTASALRAAQQRNGLQCQTFQLNNTNCHWRFGWQRLLNVSMDQ